MDLIQKVIVGLPLPLKIQGDCCAAAGSVYLCQYQLANAEQSLIQAVELHKQAHDILGEAIDCRKLGDLYLHQDRLGDAEQSLIQAVELHKQAHDILGEANDCQSLGDLYLHWYQLADVEQSLIQGSSSEIA